MKPVRSRVVQFFHVRYLLGSIFAEHEPSTFTSAVDLHVHAQSGTEDPFEIAKAAR